MLAGWRSLWYLVKPRTLEAVKTLLGLMGSLDAWALQMDVTYLAETLESTGEKAA